MERRVIELQLLYLQSESIRESSQVFKLQVEEKRCHKMAESELNISPEVRAKAQSFLQEMKAASRRSWQSQKELERAIQQEKIDNYLKSERERAIQKGFDPDWYLDTVANALKSQKHSVYLDWDADAQMFTAHVPELYSHVPQPIAYAETRAEALRLAEEAIEKFKA